MKRIILCAALVAAANVEAVNFARAKNAVNAVVNKAKAYKKTTAAVVAAAATTAAVVVAYKKGYVSRDTVKAAGSKIAAFAKAAYNKLPALRKPKAA